MTTTTMGAALRPVEVSRWVGPSAESVAVRRVDHDSRRVEKGSLFCCIRGSATDGHEHAGEAVERGAVGLLVEHPVDLGGVVVPQAVVDSVRRAMGPVAARVSGDPSAAMAVVGVTGTNGKTTVTHLLGSVLRAAGRTTEVMGTLSGVRTTPEAPELQRALAASRAGGVDVVAMEVSSHALDMHRVDGTHFAVAVFTNLSQDHLDHHGTMDAYFEAKARLFTAGFARSAVVNLDDPRGPALVERIERPVVGYSLDDLEGLRVGLRGSRFRWRGHGVELALGGRFNVSNALAAAEAALLLGLDPAEVAAGLSQPLTVPGRFERIDTGRAFEVVVDFAHTPDGLDNLLAAARESVGDGRVVVVFGCGGRRDATKRAPMGAVAARRADAVVLTADNSRDEDTDAIIEQIDAGLRSVAVPRADRVVVEPDRRTAIAVGLGMAGSGDVVVIAGKGHETTQTIGSVVTPFDDRTVVRELLGRDAQETAR